MKIDFEEFFRQVKLYYMFEYGITPMWNNKTVKSVVQSSFQMDLSVQNCCGNLRDTIYKEAA
jgi:hypothetical protein